MNSDFIVVDTEGNPLLRELAVIDSQGTLIYHAFVDEHLENKTVRVNRFPLSEILTRFQSLARGQRVIFHNSQHDLEVLHYSSARVGLSWSTPASTCTVKLAQSLLPNLASYSLEYLSKHLHLRLHNRLFHPDLAHDASYDAAFTHLLYRHLMQIQLKSTLQSLPNPFGTSRVDNPFQTHKDRRQIYAPEFELLKSILQDIKLDPNHQSRGAVVVGEPGSGKTHLMMRLAKELLSTHRLLFIRQPNNPDTVLFHVYSRILESLVEQVDGTDYTQLDYLLANSFAAILRAEPNPTFKEQFILGALSENDLDRLGAEGTAKKLNYWKTIEARVSRWWLENHAAAGYSLSILKGIVKYCSYTNPRYRERVTRWLSGSAISAEEAAEVGLESWQDDLAPATFSLEAMTVLSKLSVLDEPLIVVFDQLEGLGLPHNRDILLQFGEAVKEIFTHVNNSLVIVNLFPDRWEQFRQVFDGSIVDRLSQYQLQLRRPSSEQLKQILAVRLEGQEVRLEELFDPDELENILGQPSIRAALNRAADYYRHKIHGIALPLVYEPSTSQPPSDPMQRKLQALEETVAALQQQVAIISQRLEMPDSGVPAVTSLSPVEISHESVSTLSPEEEMVLQYLEQQRPELEREYERFAVISDSDDLGKLVAIAEAFKCLRTFETSFLRLQKRKIPEHLVIRTRTPRVVGFLHTESGTGFTARIGNFNQLVVAHPELRFGLFRDARLPEPRGKVGKRHIEQLRHCPNGEFVLLDRETRLQLELLYKLVVDVQNRDLEVDLPTALQVVLAREKRHWLTQLFDRTAA